MSPDARSPSNDPRQRRAGLWIPALLPSLALATVIGGIAVGHVYWKDLRSSMGRMDETLEHARERQRQMVEHFSQAQGLLLAQQRRLQEVEESLRAREAQLEAERADLEEARARLALVSAPRDVLAEQDRARGLAWRLDLALTALPDPGGLESAAETLAALTDWAAASPLVAGSTLAATVHAALAESRDALAQARTAGAQPLAKRVARLGTEAAVLSPWPMVSTTDISTPGLAVHAGAGHLCEQLEIALFALHRGDDALFRLALDTASAWLIAFYDPADPAVQGVQSELIELRQVPISRDLNGLRAGLARLRAVLGELIQTPPTTGAD